MSMIAAWVFFPLVLAAIGLGWGAFVQWLAGDRELGPLTIPLGLAAAIVIAGILTAFSATASIAAPITAIGALAGLGYVWGRARIGAAPAIAAIAVLLVYGAPVILSGQATFLGYVRLDDTATWFNLIDQLFSHGRSFASLPLSTYKLNAETNLGTGVYGGTVGAAYPPGAFMLTGVGHWVTGIDIAWIFQPYLACCAAALSLAIYGLLKPLLDWRWLRAFVCFIAAQSALLYGYAAWGGIKELTCAFLVALGAALTAQLLAREELRPRNALSLAVAGGALIITIGPGVAVYAIPVVLALTFFFVLRARHGFDLLRLVWVLASLVALTAVCALPLWLLIGHYLQVDQASFSANQTVATTLGNLVAPLRGLQIAGIWLAGDFRDVVAAPSPYAIPAQFPTYYLIWLALIAGAGGTAWTLYKGQRELALYLFVALFSVVVPQLDGVTPWLIGKALAISSPAILLAGLTGGALLFRQERTLALVAGVVVLGALAGGVLWSNWLQYRDVTLAPRDQLSELQTIGTKVAGKGPTFLNEYQIYGDRHFLRAGAPVEPAEYRQAPQDLLPTVTGAWLTKSAFADIDSFSLATLRPFRSLVTRISPVASRPPSIYNLVWSGTYYALWQQPAQPKFRVIERLPLGDTNLDYCGAAEDGRPTEPLCSIQPAAVPRCPEVLALGRKAAQDGGELKAWERTNPIVLRGTQTSWPASWIQAYTTGQPEDALSVTTPGTATAHVSLPSGPQPYQLWLGGSFDRGFIVHIDGHLVGSVSDELNNLGDYDEVGHQITLGPGVHTIKITYPPANLSPGNGDNEDYTSLSEIALVPVDSQSKMLTVQPAQASQLCGRSLDWIEIVAPVS